jgi:hypothetical protein
MEDIYIYITYNFYYLITHDVQLLHIWIYCCDGMIQYDKTYVAHKGGIALFSLYPYFQTFCILWEMKFQCCIL